MIAFFRNIRFADRAGKTTRALYSGERTLANGQERLTETMWLSETVTDPVVEVVADPNPGNK